MLQKISKSSARARTIRLRLPIGKPRIECERLFRPTSVGTIVSQVTDRAFPRNCRRHRRQRLVAELVVGLICINYEKAAIRFDNKSWLVCSTTRDREFSRGTVVAYGNNLRCLCTYVHRADAYFNVSRSHVDASPR